ncbi:hypothetical protein PPERSA_00324 [Pseudocohnilembus persalinus]|uniref:Hyaluronan/mRNA-binding protein domain-containing protein n=1 Tax=Pseudocohnilembus persalinus TaxID=266149 RepID=A0A0V0QH92_PSEPJ|nr:hypothetical protein PPERSA_00324 [Pseudocohnilembus persalinus]|eukprot:KRX01617.1 hypothetical protein PPERSA_00324 [Pseudocohnilembus persalinus]
MSKNQNIFAVFSDNEDSDVETNQRTQNKGEKRIRTRGKKQVKSTTEAYPEKTQKELNQQKDNQRPHQRGGVNHRNRSKDRQSGTGISGVQRNHYRKGGAGKGNLGTIKDELQREPQVEEDEEEEEEEEVEDNTMTLEQYLQNKGADLNAVLNKQEQAKQREIDQKQLEQQLKKDKLELIQKKPEREQVVQGKTAKQAPGYKPTYGGEGAELIGFRTGFVAEKQKKRAAKPAVEQVAKDGQEEVQEQVKEQVKEEGAEKQQGERRQYNKGGNNNYKRNYNNRDNQRKGGNQRSGNAHRGKGFNVDNNEQDFPTL